MNVETVLKILGNDEIARKALELLFKYSKDGYIPANELKDLDLVLLLEGKKLAVPVEAEKSSLSWNMRFVQLQKTMEIPYIIRMFLEKLKSGKADIFEVIEDYFRKIGENRPHEFVEITKEMLKERDGFLVCGDAIVRICAKYNRDGGVVIAELKGAGIISPHIGCGGFGRTTTPVYEFNKFLIDVVGFIVSDETEIDKTKEN
ncbi:hypothetical protein DRP05_01125 [Archaeoglobales archaeon]|nr:MAG: hypothetical protein DRP05_01125 [Archaeoglobales archaeon]